MDKIISVQVNQTSWSWIFKMALRDARRSKSRLLLFMSSIVIGIAALVAIHSSGNNLQNDINNRAKELLGADLALDVNDTLLNYPSLETLALEISYQASFQSMAFFPKNQESKLVEVKSLEGKFPYYGKIVTEPTNAETTFREGDPKALVDKGLLIQYNLQVGDSVKIGNTLFKIEGALIKSPPHSFQTLTAGPGVYIADTYLPGTGLTGYGSKVAYKRFYQFPPSIKYSDINKSIGEEVQRPEITTLTYKTVESNRDATSGLFKYLTGYLNLIAFIALLLGCLGVASAVHVYIKEKIKFVGILRCLGVSGKEAFLIYLTQISILGLIGSLLGAMVGVLIQTVLPKLFTDFLPIEVTFSLSWFSIFGGIFTGVFITILFALSSLMSVRHVSPLVALRGIEEGAKKKMDRIQLMIYTAVFIFIIGFAFIQTGVLKDSLLFTLAIVLAFGLLTAVAKASMWCINRFFPSKWPYIWRQSLANLYRPNNQTLVLISSIGLGTVLITTLYFVQALLINQVEVTKDEDLPNLMVFDIQSNQVDAITALAKNKGLPIMQSVPVVTMRLKSINGIDYDREFENLTGYLSGSFKESRVTYRDDLIDSEELVRGIRDLNAPLPDWAKEVPKDAILVSLTRNYERIVKVKFPNLKLGDTLIWDVQGVPIRTLLGSIRKVGADRVQKNFKAIFPTGILENAPQFHVLLTKAKTTRERALFQRAIVKAYPNVSVTSFSTMLDTLDNMLDKISFVIRFIAFLSILTGLLVLISSVTLSRLQRIKESVLLRTIGASRRQIFAINSIEYFLLGTLASFTGIVLGALASWGLAYYYFDATFAPDSLPILMVYMGITALTILVGLVNSRSIVNKPPLEVLRNELQ